MAVAKCPHECSRCRAIELGLDHRPLTTIELVEVHGGLAEMTTNENRITYSDDTIEAELARDLAELAFVEEKRKHAELRGKAIAEIESIRSHGGGWIAGGGQRDEADTRRVREIREVVEDSEQELQEVAERAARARRRYNELASRDAARHRTEMLEVSRLRDEQRQESSASKRQSSRRSLIGRLGGDRKEIESGHR